MKLAQTFLVALLVLSPAATVLGNSFVIEPASGRKLCRWDGTCLMMYDTGMKLYSWDGTHVISYANGRKLFRWKGQKVMRYDNARKALKVQGVIPVALVIALVTGQV